MVAREVAEHRRTNVALVNARAPLRMRVLQFVLGERGLLQILALYGLLVVLLSALEWIVSSRFALFVPGWANGPTVGPFLKDLSSYFLTAQVTVIGLLFPIAVALVTLIVQREDASSTSSDVQVYYSETLAYRVGASGIALSIVLAVQLLWPAQFLVRQLEGGASTGLSKLLLSGLHLIWLVANLAALWHFLVTSLSFIRPVERAVLRRRFAANVAIPRDLAQRLALAVYASLGARLLEEQRPTDTDEGPSLLFGSDLGEWGEVEIGSPSAINRVLYDVWLKPLAWAVGRWWRRCNDMPQDPQGRDSRPTLIFSPELTRTLHEPGVICRRRNGLPLSPTERFVVKRCFRFRTEI
jgi:hypothetical protein